jgi:type I restriction enzyme R subunit
VGICKETFGRGDDFVQKITGKVDDPLKKIREFRNRPQPSVVVTVDLLTTGVDIPAIEFIVFLRPVKSRILWVQMLGRGTRLCPDIHKTHFKIFDCFGGTLVKYFAGATDFRTDPPRKKPVPVKGIITNILDQVDLEANLSTLTRRLFRLDRCVTPEGRERLEGFIAGSREGGLARSWTALWQSRQSEAINLLKDEQFQDFLENYPRIKKTFWIADSVEDRVTSSVVIDGKPPEDYLDSFQRFIDAHGDEITALQILRQSPDRWNVDVLEELRQKLRENHFNEQNLQRAYQLTHNKALADLISLIRWAYKTDSPVYTAQERVDRAIAAVTEGMDLTPEQEVWLGYIREHLAQNLSIALEDFENAPIFERHGGRGKANKVFEGKLAILVQSLNGAVAA